MVLKRNVVTVLVTFLLLVGGSTATAAYPDKTIEFVVGYKPGGGYSDWAQALAPFIEKHLPRKTNVVVRHMDGAGSAIAANYMQKARPDGYTIGIYNVAGLAATQLARKVQYDLSKVTWLARVSYDDTVAVVNGKGPYKSMLDFKKQTKPEYVVSTKGLAATNTITGAVTFAKMGVKWKPLNHAGTGESVLAVIRGDADITWGSFESLQQYISSGDLKLVLYYDSERHKEFPTVPIPADLGMAELNESMNSHRLIGAPPGLAADVRTVLETAIRKAVEDPEFANAVKKMKRTPAYLDGKQSTELVQNVLQSYQTYADTVKALLSQDKQ